MGGGESDDQSIVLAYLSAEGLHLDIGDGVGDSTTYEIKYPG